MQDFLDPTKIRIMRDSHKRVLLKIGDEEKVVYRVMRNFPLTGPEKYLSLADEEGKELGMIRQLKDLDPSSKKILEEELERAYFVPVIKRILAVRELYGGVTDIAVETDKGYREFELRSKDTIRFVGLSRIMITDVDGNRYEIPNMGALDARSKSLIEWMV